MVLPWCCCCWCCCHGVGWLLLPCAYAALLPSVAHSILNFRTFICKYQNETEQQNSVGCCMQRHPMSNGHLLIAVNQLDRAASNLIRSVDLYSHWFQIFLICGNLIDCSGRRYKYLLLCVIAVVLEEIIQNK